MKVSGKLTEADIIMAIKKEVAFRGHPEVSDIIFTMGRKGNGISAELIFGGAPSEIVTAVEKAEEVEIETTIFNPTPPEVVTPKVKGSLFNTSP